MTPRTPVDGTPALTFSVWVGGIIRRWAMILKVLAVTIVLGALAGFVLPPVYRAHASFVPNTSAASSRAGQALGSLGGLGGLASQLGVGSLADPSESPAFYARLIESDELKRRLARSRFPNERTAAVGDSADLIDILGITGRGAERRMEIAVKRLGRIVRTKSDRATNLVWVDVESRWPGLAAVLANRTVELVNDFNREQRVSRARAKREFLETRLATAYADLSQAEDEQRRFYEQNRQWRNSPSLVFEESRLDRNVDLAADLHLTLRREFETARLDEFNDAALITVVDTAVTPQKPAWPRYGVLFATLLIVGSILGVMVAGSATILEDWRRRNPVGASFLRESLAAAPLPLRKRARHMSEGAAAIR